MNPAYAFFYMALGAGILLVAEILADAWKLRHDAQGARRGSVTQLSALKCAGGAPERVFQVMDGMTQREELLKGQIERIRGAKAMTQEEIANRYTPEQLANSIPLINRRKESR